MLDKNFMGNQIKQIIPEVTNVPDYLVCCSTPVELSRCLYNEFKDLNLTIVQQVALINASHLMYNTWKPGLETKQDDVVGYVDLQQLQRRCSMSKADYVNEGTVYGNKRGWYIYKDNGAKILGVAHLDTVVDTHHFYRLGNKVYCPQLDDRLGAYVILDILSKKFNMDILLTDGEESGQSTAELFSTTKQYNWMLEVDRTGNTAALYQYHSKELVEKLSLCGIKVGHGSFTDISSLGHLDCAGINFPCAYYNYHSVQSNCNLDELNEHIKNMLLFIEMFQDEHITYVKGQYQSGYGGYYSYGYGKDFWDDHNTHIGKKHDAEDWLDSVLDLDYTIISCPECGLDCFAKDVHCEDCGELLQPETGCKYCVSADCFGMQRCLTCQFDYHDSLYIACFNVCRDCLSGIFEVPDTLFLEFESSDEDLSNSATLKILEITKI